MPYWTRISLTVAGLTCCLALPPFVHAADPPTDKLVAALQALDGRVLTDSDAAAAPTLLRRALSERIAEGNRRSTEEWKSLHDRAGWEQFRRRKLLALAKTLGPTLTARVPLKPDLQPGKPAVAIQRVEVTGKLTGPGYRIENLLIEALSDYWIAANLYLPDGPPKDGAKMPGIVICHSHHSAKTSGELQDMGQLWARSGCCVLVMDQIGYGDRRIHPFASAADFPRQFALGRQSYYFRYDLGIQLHHSDESLIGIMAGDLMSGVTYLCDRPDVDAERIVLLGSVAGGGDPVAVAGALDPRISVVGPFNFGGPQPETKYPLPDDAETSFNYAGGGSWESTRNLRGSIHAGFLPWVIVGGIAPRKLIYGHEFAWDGERDPVWKRLQSIYGWYDAKDNLGVAHGRGTLKGRPPESSHCDHIGRVHRQMIHPLLERWCAINVGDRDIATERHDSSELMCWTDEARARLKPVGFIETGFKNVSARSATIRRKVLLEHNGRPLAPYLGDVLKLLGPSLDSDTFTPRELEQSVALPEGCTCRRFVMRRDEGILVPVLLLEPKRGDSPTPAVLAAAQEGKAAFLRSRAEELAGLLRAGIAVCLLDVRGTGETVPEDSDRDQYGEATGLSATALMTAPSLLGQRFMDFFTVSMWLEKQPSIDATRIGYWGDSFALPNPADAPTLVPRRIDGRPRNSEPLGGVLALLGGAASFPTVKSVYVHGGLLSYEEILKSPCVTIPHDAQFPGILNLGDLPCLAGILAVRPKRPSSLCLSGLVDGANRAASLDAMRTTYAETAKCYQANMAADDLVIAVQGPSASDWFGKTLK